MPVLGSSDLRRISLVATDKPPQQFACLHGDINRQQKMPNHRHPVPAENEALYIGEV
jgi:hypothetical protein